MKFLPTFAAALLLTTSAFGASVPNPVNAPSTFIPGHLICMSSTQQACDAGIIPPVGAIVSPAIPTFNVNSVQTGHFGADYPFLFMMGWSTLADGGEGTLQLRSCVPDGGSCFGDIDGHTYARTTLNGDFRQWGLVFGSPYDMIANPITVLSASTIVNTAMSVMSALNVPEFTTSGVSVKIGTSITVPPHSGLGCGLSATRLTDDGHYNSLIGTLELSHGASILFTGSSSENSKYTGCYLVPEWYVNPLKVSDFGGFTFHFPPVDITDLEYMRGNVILADDVAVRTTGSNGIHIRNVSAIGFDECYETSNSANNIYDDVSCDGPFGIYGGNGGEQSKYTVVNVTSILNHQVDDVHGDRVDNENAWTVTAIAQSPTLNVWGRHQCLITLGPVDAAADPPFPGTNLRTSNLNVHGDPITFPFWMSNFGPDTTHALACEGNGPQAITVVSQDATTAVLDVNGSEYGTGADVVSFTGRWTVGGTIDMQAIGIVSGNIASIHKGQLVSSNSGANGIPNGSKIRAVCLSCHGPDPDDPYLAVVYIDQFISISKSVDTTFTLDSGTFVAGVPCDEHSNGACGFLNAAENVYAGENLPGDISSKMLPASRGHPYAVAYFADDSTGYATYGAIAFGHHYSFVARDGSDFAHQLPNGDENGELDDLSRIGTYTVGNAKGTYALGGIGKTGRSIVNDQFTIQDTATATQLNQSSIPAGLSTIVVDDTSGFGATNTIRTFGICQTVHQDGTCRKPEEYVQAEVVDGTHLKLLSRGGYFSQENVFTNNAHILQQRVGSGPDLVSYTAMTTPNEIDNGVDFEIAHGGITQSQVRTKGVGRFGIVSANAAIATFTNVQSEAITILYENATAASIPKGCGNTFAVGQPWNQCDQGSQGQSATAIVAPANDTNNNVLAAILIKGGTEGSNGCDEIDALWTFTSSASAKTLRVYMNSNGSSVVSTPYLQLPTTITQVTASTHTEICNAGSLTVQKGGLQNGTYGTTAASLVTGAIDTSQDHYVILTGQKTTGGETLTLEKYSVNVKPKS